MQSAFLAVWLAPIGALKQVPSCVLHCYACPLASAACPIGILANAAAWHVVPLLTIGVLVVVGATLGSLACGWACPMGFLQDLLAKLPVRKFRIPNWMGWGRYAVLIGLVLLVPFLWGEESWLFFCRVCPAGAVGAGLPRTLMTMSDDTPQVMLSSAKLVILPAFLVAAILAHRSWCKVLCPLGGLLAIFNRFSLVHVRFHRDRCTQCNTCRARCSMGVHVEQRVNHSQCIRCLDCTSCGAFGPAIGVEKGAAAPAPAPNATPAPKPQPAGQPKG